MKKSILLLLLIAISIVTPLFGQDSIPSAKTDYLKKSRNQRTAGKVLLIGGGALLTVGFALALDDLGGLFNSADKDNSKAASILIYTGGAAMLASIPLFLSGAKNSRKAMGISLGTQPVLQTRYYGLSIKRIPSLSLTLNL
ncbi:MAG TPA: hypothetical protein VF476_14355 [Chitinophagaceae bacterium]